MSSTGNGAMTLSVEDFKEREKARKGVSYCSIHACDHGFFYSTEERDDVVYSSPS